jgi:nitrite reductase/ring-hydroxylating ferredoxin subunit
LAERQRIVRLCHSDELAIGQARGFQVGKSRVIVVRTARDSVRAYLNRCPHLGVPLNWTDDDFMDSDGSLIRCSTHGALFEPDSGLCLVGPCRGEHLWQLDCQLQDDQIVIDPDELPPSDPLR